MKLGRESIERALIKVTKILSPKMHKKLTNNKEILLANDENKNFVISWQK